MILKLFYFTFSFQYVLIIMTLLDYAKNWDKNCYNSYKSVKIWVFA